MATSKSILSAALDNDLLQRAIAIAADEGVKNPEGELAHRMFDLATAPVTDDGSTVASVYEYATAVREEALAKVPPEPGANPAAVTDEHLRYAIRHRFLPTS